VNIVISDLRITEGPNIQSKKNKRVEAQETNKRKQREGATK